MSSQSHRKASSLAESIHSDNASLRDMIPSSAGQHRDVSAKIDSLSRKTPESHTEQLDDLAALFMPEILNQQQQLSLLIPQTSDQGIKEEDFGFEYFQNNIESTQPSTVSWNQTGSLLTASQRSTMYYSQHPCQPGGLQNQVNLQALDYPPVPVSHQNAPYHGSSSNFLLLPSSSGSFKQKTGHFLDIGEAHSDLSLLSQQQQYQLQLQQLQQHELYKNPHHGRQLFQINNAYEPQQAFQSRHAINSRSSSSGRYDVSSQPNHSHSLNTVMRASINTAFNTYQQSQFAPQNPYYTHNQCYPQEHKQPSTLISSYPDLNNGQLGAPFNRCLPQSYMDTIPSASVGLGVEHSNWPGIISGIASGVARPDYVSKATESSSSMKTANGAFSHSSQSVFDEPKQHGSNAVLKKAKSQKHKTAGVEFEIDYSPAKLTRLLDFKKIPGLDSALVTTPGDYSIIDSSSNPVQVTLNGFLNGRFLTNDIDNNKYIRSRLEVKKSDSDHLQITKEPFGDAQATVRPSSTSADSQIQDARVISCYRRNFIQISLNLNINGFTSESKLLRLKSSELGYTITRVIKFLKIEILASTNTSSSRSVPVIILNESSKDDRDKKRQGRPFGERKDDCINPSPVANTELVVVLNDECDIENGEINKYFVVKKLQFKSATPNNGNQTFQNYYHLRLKLIAVVADLYYNDPVSDSENDGNPHNTFALDKVNHRDGCGGDDAEMDNNEVTLYEVVSEPIIVRGRNPNFYTDRNNILIEGRSCSSKASFQAASKAPPSACGYSESSQVRAVNAPLNSRSLKTVHDLPAQTNATAASLQNQPVLENDDDDGAMSNDMEASLEKEQLSGDKLCSVDEDDCGNLAGGSWSEQNAQLSPMEFADARQKSPLENVNGYKYFPVSNVYYLPPINVVYFPHGAHLLEIVKTRKDLADSDQKSNSNVYFK